MIRNVLMILTLIGATAPVMAQDTAQQAPIEISADKTLEWSRNEKQYIANGNAIVRQGDTTIKGDVIAADYRETAKTNFDIYRMTATGHVTIDSKGSAATGDKAVYDITTGIATMTGSNLRMESPEQTVTATDRFEYDVTAGKVKAIGNARVVRATDTLQADSIAATLARSSNGSRQKLEKMEATGHVKITTPTETLTGNRASYDSIANRAVVTGNVKILRGPNELTGERAEVDLKTNISRLFGSSIEDGQTGGRVRGVFYPGASKAQ